MARRWSRLVAATIAAAVVGATVLACGSQNDVAMTQGYERPAPHENGGGGNAAGGGPGAGGEHSGDAGAAQPPEQELESKYETPVATEHYVWIANPTSGRVSYVNASTFEIRTTEVGLEPSVLSAVPDTKDDVAVVLNKGSQSATVLRADKQGRLRATTFPVANQANTWTVSSKGEWAVSWNDYHRETGRLEPTQGFQDITLLRLEPGKESATRLSVGYRPSGMFFNDKETRLFAVTQDGVSVIDLTSSPPKPLGVVQLSDDPLSENQGHDVHITPDGTLALLPDVQGKAVIVVELESGKRVRIAMPSRVTDLDVSPDGKLAIAVAREAHRVALLPLASIVSAPDQFTSLEVSGAVVGSVSMAAEAKTALLYSNAVEQQDVVVLDYSSAKPTLSVRKLHAPVLAALVAPSGSSALLIHPKMKQSSKYRGAFSVLNVQPVLPAKLVGTQGTVQSAAISPDGNYALVTEQWGSSASVNFVHMQTQQVSRIDLASPPMAVGVVPAVHRGYVAQQHPEGRITFIDFDSGQVRTLTGFELASQVVDGSN